MILVPGLAGSELRHKETGEAVWFRATKSKLEDLRLPISTDIASIHDSLVPGDVLRVVKVGPVPVTDVYGGFIEAMKLRAGYHEEKWDSPSEKGSENAIYVFPYDWRLDVVTNARRLVTQTQALKLKLKRPDLKFDIVGHSLGGLISRYAAMYGDSDVPSGTAKPQPTWAGAAHFNKIILMGTPNEGSVSSLSSLLNGFTISGIHLDLPFVHDTSKFMVFTIPAAYELLPAPGTLRAFDDRLEPLEVDLYDVKTWNQYGWNVTNDRDFVSNFSAAERKIADAYFETMLARAKRLHEALAASNGKVTGISFQVLGSDCGMAPDSIVIRRDSERDSWKTLFRPKGFTRSDGERITDGELRKIMMTPGDGVVTRRSLETATQSATAKVASMLDSGPGKYICGDHNKLAANVQVQDYIIGLLRGKTVIANNAAAVGK
ncbi:MAG: esterase/lipase family protein [Pyrinomonadaceae bacterium]